MSKTELEKGSVGRFLSDSDPKLKGNFVSKIIRI
jgi:hypothetical protein